MSLENIIKAKSTKCLWKLKIELKDFYMGWEKAKVFTWKALLVFSAMYFLSALTSFVIAFLPACTCNWREVAPSSDSPSHGWLMDKMAYTWQYAQTGHKTVHQIKWNR